MLRVLLLSLILWIGISKGQYPTCAAQFQAYYQGIGNLIRSPLPPGTALEPIIITTFAGGINISFNFGSVARQYQSALTPGILTSPPIINYVSFIRPWCTTSIEVVCGGALLTSLPKTAYCRIIDYDVHAEPAAGRFFLYNPEASGIPLPASCDGNLKVRMFGEFVVGPGVPNSFLNESRYSYSLRGLPREFRNLSLTDAITDYQTSLCEPIYVDTNLDNIPDNQTQLVCGDKDISCAVVPRPGTNNQQIAPTPSFACVGSVPGEAGQFMVWHISFLGQANSLKLINYGVKFCAQFDDACNTTTGFTNRQGFPGTRVQWRSNFTGFDSVIVILFPTIPGSITFFNPHYVPAVTDPFIRQVPCICGLSVDCTATGRIDFDSEYSKVLQPNNAPPRVNATTPIFILPGQQRINVSAWASFDPDRLPNTLTFRWEVYNTTPSPVVIENPDSPNATVVANFVLGTYQLIVYVSDGQIVYFARVNITAEANVIIVVLARYIEVQYVLLRECPSPLGSLPNSSVSIPLNGSASFGLNPVIPLFYNWTQTSGSNITVPFECDPSTVDYYPVEALYDTNTSIMKFVPPVYGLYTFRLTVCDNGTSPCRFQEIHVSVELNFDGPNSTKDSYTDFPDAPTFNVSNGSVPTISFVPTSGASFQPFPRPPSFFVPTAEPLPSSTNVTSFFPRLPPPSAAELALLFFALICAILMWFLLFSFCLSQLRNDHRSYFDRTPIYQPPNQY